MLQHSQRYQGGPEVGHACFNIVKGTKVDPEEGPMYVTY